MENAVEALQYGFAVLVFVIALSVSMNLMSQAKSTSDSMILSADPESFYTDVKLTFTEETSAGRIVGVESIIPTLYRNYKENYIIEFYNGDRDSDGKLTGLILRLDLSDEDRRDEIWTAYPNIDVKKRLDILISGGNNGKGVINNQAYVIANDKNLYASNEKGSYKIETDGLYKYCKGKQFVEEYGFLLSGKQYANEKLSERIDKIVIRYVEI